MRSRSLSLIFGSYTSAVGWKQHTFISSCLHILFDRVGRCHSSSLCSPVSPLVTGHRCVSPLSSHETLVTTTVPAHTLTLCRYVPCLLWTLSTPLRRFLPFLVFLHTKYPPHTSTRGEPTCDCYINDFHQWLYATLHLKWAASTSLKSEFARRSWIPAVWAQARWGIRGFNS